MKIVIFGAGDAGRRAISELNSSTYVLSVCDNDSLKQGRSLSGHLIIAPSELPALNPEQVVIASMYWREIQEQLTSLGIDSARVKVHKVSKSANLASSAKTTTDGASTIIPDWMTPDLKPRSHDPTPLVSIILPTVDRASVLPRSIDSVLDQTYRSFELLVVDDGSQDETTQLLQSYAAKDPRIRTFKQDRKGVSAARNYGLSAARGDLIAYIDSDNRWHADYLALMVRGFSDSTRSTGYAGYNVYDFQTGYFRTTIPRFDFEELQSKSSIDLNCFMHRKTVLHEYGGFDEKMTRLVDWELILRYTRMRPPFVIGCALADYFRDCGTNRITDMESFQNNRERLQQRQSTLPAPLPRAQGRLRVAFVQHEFPALSQTFVQTEIAILLGLGVDVSVFYFRDSLAKATIPSDWDVETYTSREHLARLLTSRSVDAVHTHFAVPHPADYIVPVCSRLRLPFTMKPHAFDIFRNDHDQRHHITNTAGHDLCKRVFCEGSFHEKYLSDAGVPDGKLEIARNVFDWEPFLAVKKPLSPRVERIVSISRFVEKKGYHLLIPAFRELPDPNLRLELYGYGEQQEQLELLADGDTRISINRGPQSSMEAANILARADLFVLPCTIDRFGDTDGLPTVLMEAIAAGVPVLSTPIASTPDLVIDGSTGLLAKVGSIESLKNALLRALDLPLAQRQQLVDNARGHLEKEFHPVLNAKRLIACWEAITAAT